MKFNKAMVSSISGEFEPYVLENVVSVLFCNGKITITYIDKTKLEAYTTAYNSTDVIISIA